ncbi:Calcineurin-like phosphoesterase [Mycobacteroides abscessus subsp. abscessus]|nr:Calcineurin-like phosphoesterase [Mycobacteroides abscessus subsp. abscessus]
MWRPYRDAMVNRRTLITTAGVGALGASLGLAAPASAKPGGNDKGRGRGRGRDKGQVTTFNVISDIQGDLGDFGVALDDMAKINPGSSGLAIAGDITPRGYDFEYANVRKRMDKHTSPGTVAWAIGNHEFYVPKYKDPNTLSQDTWPNDVVEDSLFKSFYNFAGRNSIYEEFSFGGIPVLAIGTERYMRYHDEKLWDEVWMSDKQFSWLEDRLDYWNRRNKPIMIITHHPLPNTVSGTRNKLYLSNYLQSDRLLDLLGPYKNVFLFSGHTHWDLELSDWYTRRVVPSSGNLSGFNVFNTGAIETGYTDNGTGGEKSVPGGFNQGLQVEVSDDSVTVRARDFKRKAWMKEITVPLA